MRSSKTVTSKQVSTSKVNSTEAIYHASPVTSFSPTGNQAVSDLTAANLREVIVNFQDDTVKSLVKLPVLENTIAADFSSAILNVPVNVKLPDQPDPNTSLEPIDTDVVSSGNQKIFSLQTGLFETEPSIIVSSEFVPLYNENSKTRQGQALTIKETAKMVTAKTAINVLSQNAGSVTLVNENKRQLKEFIDAEQEFATKLLKLTNDTLNILDVGSYALPTINQRESIGSIYEILKKSGYNTSNVVKYTETKMWLQSLVEVKRGISTHSSNLTAQNFVRRNVKNDEDSFLLSDIESTPKELKKIWMNPYHPAVPTLGELTDTSKINDSLFLFSDFEKKQYINLAFANADLVTEDTSSSKVAYEKSVLSNKVLESYIESGRDIAIIANAITKESTYSSYLSKLENFEILLNTFGYEASRTGDNFRVWDYLIGRFPKKVTDLIVLPTGNGKSLASFSQRAVKNGNEYYNVLTFENNSFENSSITPGSTYYVDSSLSATDGRKFDSSRLSELIEITSNVRKTTETLFDILGYSISNTVIPYQGIYEDYQKKQYVTDASFERMTDRLSVVANLYRGCINISQNQIVSLDTRALGSNGYRLSLGEIIGVRLASLICKLAVYPSGLYTKSAGRLKTLLFMWLLNVAIQQMNPSVSNNSTILNLKKRIAAHIGGTSTKTSNPELDKAMMQYRCVPVTTTSASDLKLEQSSMEFIVREQKAAASSYVQAVYNKIFAVDADRGIWKTLVDMLKSVMSNSQVYVNEFTAYSGMTKVAYLYNNFDLMLRIVAAQTPENIIGMYSRASSRSTKDLVDTGILIGEVTKAQLDETYNVNTMLVSDYFPKYYVNKLNDSMKSLDIESNLTVRQIAFYRKYLSDIGRQLNSFKEYLEGNFDAHLARVSGLYQSDTSLSVKQRNELLSLSFSEEQLRLSKYVMSEYNDRITKSDTSESNLKVLPICADMPSGFIDYMPINELDAVSHTMLSSYFKTEQFLSLKGNNKKIISVGIPPRLIRSIHTAQKLSTDSSKFTRQNLVRIKLYKLDRMHPDVVYLPKSYLFEMTRFPTRVAANWNFNYFLNGEFDLFSTPTKFMTSNGDILLHKNFSDAFPNQYYGSVLKDDEKSEIYVNHSISFLCEEYLRWFTDCKFDESRYTNFTQVNSALPSTENQYLNFASSAISSNSATVIDATKIQKANNQVTAFFRDPASGRAYKMPLNLQTAQLNQTAEKVYSIPVDKTVRSYFMNETFFLSPDISKRKMSYFKKFDRVFSILVDPDDFYVDESLTNSSTLQSMKNIGILTGGETINGGKSPYRHRDTMPNDPSYNEYFVTVEPYDYVQEYRE